jgi:hypothetical protein
MYFITFKISLNITCALFSLSSPSRIQFYFTLELFTLSHVSLICFYISYPVFSSCDSKIYILYSAIIGSESEILVGAQNIKELEI